MTYSKNKLIKTICGAATGAATIMILLIITVASAGETLVTGPACAIDGDSLVIGGEMVGGRCRGGDVEIRLVGIDAPEWNQTCGDAGKEWPCGEAATAAVRAMIAGRDVVCHPVGRGHYKRTLATCEADGVNIARQLMLDGLAVSYSGGYKVEEATARTASRGIWSGPFITPAKWRKLKK